jgi:hypothetical protein
MIAERARERGAAVLELFGRDIEERLPRTAGARVVVTITADDTMIPAALSERYWGLSDQAVRSMIDSKVAGSFSRTLDDGTVVVTVFGKTTSQLRGELAKSDWWPDSHD